MGIQARNVHELAASVPEARYVGERNVTVNDIVYDSRHVRPGALFVCWKGATADGHSFAREAVAKGARALFCERYLDELAHVPQIVVPNVRERLGELASAFYGHPSRRLTLIGVTGTNGKTTSTYLLHSIFQRAHGAAGLIGTLGSRIGDRYVPGDRTTPEAPDIQRLLAEMAAARCTTCSMEVSSHGIDLHRISGARFAYGVFTNLTQDHLDYHTTFEAYRDAKLRFFSRLEDGAIINADDPHASHFARATAAPVYLYGVESPGAEYRASSIRFDAGGVTYVAHTPSGSIEIRLALTGVFNVYNSLGALAVAHRLGVPLEDIAAGLAGVQVPGRFERVSGAYPVSVIVDYAHTPDGLENVLRAARALGKGRLILLFGAGGDRDRTKRPRMGSIAASLADFVIVTSDNPRSEDPETICEEIEAGMRQVSGAPAHWERVVDRREAIREAIRIAEPGDLVLIAGKGHETYQEIRGVRRHFDDREEARAALEERFGRATAQR